MSTLNVSQLIRSRVDGFRNRAGAHRQPETQVQSAEELYLDLMKRCLTNSIYGGQEEYLSDETTREKGVGWPRTAHTMVGLRRLDNIQFCVQDVLRRKVPGDLIETGVWRGGSTIFMRALLKVHGDACRKVWVADSFQGLPPPDASAYPQDTDDNLHMFEELAIPLARVRDNFGAMACSTNRSFS